MTLQVAQEHIADLHRNADAARPLAEIREDRGFGSVIALRKAGRDEAADVRRLAALDSSRPLHGESLVAVVDGEMVAAISLDDGRVVADPLAATADVRALLETRAAQVAPHPRRRRPRFRPHFA